MLLIAQSIEGSLGLLSEKLLDTLDGIPANDLNAWKPVAARDGSHEMNTFAALATHTLGSAENWTLLITGARPNDRDRDAEFHAQATLDDLRARRNAWLTDLHTQLEGMTDADFAAPIPATFFDDEEPGWTVLRGMIHAVDHTALHLGHVQIQRQLWEDEQGR